MKRALLIGLLTLVLMAGYNAAMAQEERPLSRRENLLQNADFEGATSHLLEGVVGDGWIPFGSDATQEGSLAFHVRHVDAGNGDNGDGVMPTNTAQSWAADTSVFAGVYQVVEVGEVAAVHLSARTRARALDSAGGIVESTAWIRQRIGVDPDGGTDPAADSVVWTVPANFMDKWGNLSMEAEVKSEHVTVFLSAYPTESPVVHEIYFDDVALIAVEQPLPPVRQVPVVAGQVANYSPPACGETLLEGMIEGCGVVAGQQGFALVSSEATGGTGGEGEALSEQQFSIPTGVFLLIVGILCMLRLIQFEAKRRQ